MATEAINLGNLFEDKNFEPFIKKIEPEIFTGGPRQILRLQQVCGTLRDQFQASPTQEIEIITFFKAFGDIFIALDGAKTAKNSKDVTRCAYLGTIQARIPSFNNKKIDKDISCKLAGKLHPRLEFLVNTFKQIFLAYLRKIPEGLRNNIDIDERIMKQFTHALTNLVYFTGQKTTQKILAIFGSFFTEINSILGREVIRITCKVTNSHMCGRGITYYKCSKNESSNRYFVAIDQTESENNNTISTSIIERASAAAKMCGGRRATRRHRGTKKTRKSKH